MAEFQDIFSKRKTKEKVEIKPKVIIDYREKNSLVPAILHRLGFEIEMKELKVADYIINEIAIERKTVDDFLSSMINKRLEKQLEEIKQYPKRILLIEGIEEKELYHKNSKVNENAIRGMILSIVLKHETPIIFTKNSEDTAIFMKVLANKKENIHSTNPNKKTLNEKERARYILESFEGIGPKTAEKLLEKLKSLRNIFSASKDILEEIIGKKSEGFNVLDKKFDSKNEKIEIYQD